ncbi:uncharacterized protein CMU_029300 [Cryptosporidium muris RN66]|uniref:Kinesin motor domain-containing protein n=1 Tax=Cryptosporidium muris (strain RN66) TaxID=441375 RepID=B6AI15_CRYMR|nr:uncharacterized protein CMU_029300 [Cryptosporidium muris RN66]EEA07856.1 hypothetical protein, conserved [Cryptosporidium muris RN66]|eukprot:XP_002142205.1 hypothetical protein [Cryptosporidium muris RN66]
MIGEFNPRTFIRFCPGKKDKSERLWDFMIQPNMKTLRVVKKETFRGRTCTVSGAIYKESTCNTDIYMKSGIQQSVLRTLEGISTNVIVCGPHKTGKTHLLVGTQRSIGIVLQAVYDIFSGIRCYINGIKINSEVEKVNIEGSYQKLFVVKASVLEISEDTGVSVGIVRDLIEPENPLQLTRCTNGNLGYTIKGNPDHLFESEEKLVGAILEAVSKKKVMNAIRYQQNSEINNRDITIKKEALENLFSNYGKVWVKDLNLSGLVISLTVESVEKSELEQSLKDNEQLTGFLNVYCGSIRFFEIPACRSITSTLNVPLHGLIDLASEMSKFFYTNEKSNHIEVTNISKYLASCLLNSRLFVFGTLSPTPKDQKCCIRRTMAQYDANSTVSPHSIFDIIQFIDIIGNVMKFPLYPQKETYKKPINESQIVEIYRRKISKFSPKQSNEKMIIAAGKGLWISESSGRNTKIIRQLAYMNKTISGSGLLRILISGNDFDILRLYNEHLMSSESIKLLDENRSENKWFINQNIEDPTNNEGLLLYDLSSDLRNNQNNTTNISLYENNNRSLSKMKTGSSLKSIYFNTKNNFDPDNSVSSVPVFTGNNNKKENQQWTKLSSTPEKNLSNTLSSENNMLQNRQVSKKIIETNSLPDEAVNNRTVNFENTIEQDQYINSIPLKMTSIKSNKSEVTNQNTSFASNSLEDCDQNKELLDTEGNQKNNLYNFGQSNRSLKSFNSSKEFDKSDKLKDILSLTNSGLIGKSKVRKSKFSEVVQPNRLISNKSINLVDKSETKIDRTSSLKKKSHSFIHDFIPASGGFPQIDIYAPSFDSDINYNVFQEPKSKVLDIPDSDDISEYEPHTPNSNHCDVSKSGLAICEPESCPCCQYLSRTMCRCHYRDAAVNFNGISETAVNTDKSLLQIYESGAGSNEKIKLNGRSWDIIFDLPRKSLKSFNKNLKTRISDNTTDKSYINNHNSPFCNPNNLKYSSSSDVSNRQQNKLTSNMRSHYNSEDSKKDLEIIEKDISNQVDQFNQIINRDKDHFLNNSTVYNTYKQESKNPCKDQIEYIENDTIYMNPSGNFNQPEKLEGTYKHILNNKRQVTWCCFAPNMPNIQIPPELQPVVFRGTQTYNFPFLKPLYP